MNKIWVVALSLGVASVAHALQPAPLSSVAAVEEGQFLPGEFIVTFRPGANAQPRVENGKVVTGNAQVDRLNARFGVFAAVAGSAEGTYRFQVPAKADIREVVAAYRGLSEPVQAATGILAGSRDLRDAVTSAALAQPKQQLNGIMLAANVGVASPAALFEGQQTRNGLVQPATLQTEGSVVPGSLLQKVGCNPRVDDCGPATPPPARTGCNPKVDDNCPGSSGSQTQPAPVHRPSGTVTCQRGLDCPGDHPDTAPPAPIRPPAGWTQRPTYPPSSWRAPGSNIGFERSIPSFYSPVTGLFGWPVEYVSGYGSFGNDSTTIVRGGQDTGRGQQSSYQRTFSAKAYADKYRLYYGYVGHNCNDYNIDGWTRRYCSYWDYDYVWIWAGQNYMERTASIDVNFANDQKLLPWESESFTFDFNGNTQQISARTNSSDWSYNYTIQGPTFGTGRAQFVVQPGPKRQTAADGNAVSAGLELRNGHAWLVVHDKRAAFYAGQPLDVAIKVTREIDCKNGSGWWHDHFCSNTLATAFESRTEDQPFPKLRIAIPANLPPSTPMFAGPEFVQPGCNPKVDDCAKSVGVDVDQGTGRYYIETNWGNSGSFRRVSSPISTPDWHGISIENGRTEVTR